MHNNIMAAGSRDRPPMLAPGRYPQWLSRFLRYVDTRPNDEALRKCILSGNVGSNRKVTIRFYKLMNEMIRNNLTVTMMQVNVQFLQQLQPEWSRSHTATRHKGNELAKPITPPSETASEEDSNPEQAQRDKDMQKNLALIAKYFKKIYKPTNNNLRTSSNSKNKNVDTTPRKPKRVKDFTYHKEKMLLCKQAEQGVPLQPKQYDWLANTDEKVDEQELEAHYSYMAKI
nr:hypothetical protein [Tanacetum cinerariifolium]